MPRAAACIRASCAFAHGTVMHCTIAGLHESKEMPTLGAALATFALPSPPCFRVTHSVIIVRLRGASTCSNRSPAQLEQTGTSPAELTVEALSGHGHLRGSGILLSKRTGA